MIIIIAAVSKNNVIGKDNKLLWNIPDDMKMFKETTSGSDIIMGRKTYDSIGRPLPKRTNIVISRNKGLIIDGCIVVGSLEEAIQRSKSENSFIIGGGEIYRKSIDISDKMIITLVNGEFDGDTYFPEIDLLKWKEVSRKDFETHSFIEYLKIVE